MEKYYNQRMNDTVYSYENLIPLLKNEYQLQKSKLSRGKTEGRYGIRKNSKKKKNKVSITEKIGNDDSLGLLINIELNKLDSNFNAYFTDQDLHSRKAFHETLNKPDAKLKNKTLSNFNLVFQEDLKHYRKSVSKRENYSKRPRLRRGNMNDNSLDQLLTSAENNVMFYKKYKVDKAKKRKGMNKDEGNNISKSPVHYCKFHKINDPDHLYCKKYIKKADRNKLHKQELDSIKNCYKFHNNITCYDKNLELLPAFVHTNTLPYNFFSHGFPGNNHYNFIQNKVKNYRRLYPAVSVSSVHKVPQLTYHQDNGGFKMSENPFTIEIQESSKYSIYDNVNYSRFKKKCSVINSCEPNGSYESQYYMENNYIVYDTPNENKKAGPKEIVPRFDRSRLSHKDGYYLRKKYVREHCSNDTQEILTNTTELSSGMDNSGSNTLKLENVKKCVLKSSLPIVSKRHVINRVKLAKTKVRSSRSYVIARMTPSLQNLDRTRPVVLSNSNVKDKKKKKLEVIFPVKALRKDKKSKSSDVSKESNCNGEGNTVEMMEVLITKTSEVLRNVNFVLGESNKNNIHVSESKKITNKGPRKSKITFKRIVSCVKNVDCKSKNNLNDCKESKLIDVKQIIQSNEFREEVVRIVDNYLKENYLKDDNFDVIVIPKNENALLNSSDPICALKEIINKKFSQIENKPISEEPKIYSDLSTFNPRSLRGHVPKYEKKCTQVEKDQADERTKNESLAKKSLPPGFDRFPCLQKDNADTKNGLHKIQSMPAVKLTFLESNTGVSEKQNVKTQRINFDSMDNDMKIKHFLPCFFNGDIPCDICTSGDKLKQRTGPLKQNNLTEKNKLLTEFNEFKQVFNEVDVKHHSILHTLNCDPCAFHFKLKTCEVVNLKR